jgi:hypothetical protein
MGRSEWCEEYWVFVLGSLFAIVICHFAFGVDIFRGLVMKYQMSIIQAVIALLMSAGAYADDLASLQGTWVSEDFAWTVEFRDSTAVFRGANPFHDDSTNDTVFPEQSFRFTLETEASPRRLNINEDDFERFRKMLRPYGSAEIRNHAQPFQGIYSIGDSRDGKLPTEMQLEFYPQTRRWKTKGFNDRAFAHLEFVPTRKLRRLSDRETDLYRQLSGVWQGELKRDGLAVGPKLAYAITPGWVVFGPHRHGRMRLSIDEKQQAFKLTQTSYRESSPLATQPGFVGSGIFSERGAVGLAGFRQPREVTTNWEGLFRCESNEVLAIDLSPFPKKALSQAGKMEDFDTIVKGEDWKDIASHWEHVAKVGKDQDKALAAEYLRIRKEGYKATMLNASLTRMGQPPGEHPLSGLIRALHPDYPSEQFFEGTWRLKQKAQYDPRRSDPAKQYDHFEPIDIADGETWVFTPGRLIVKSGQSGANNDTYIPFVELRYGALRLLKQQADDKNAAYFQARIVNGDLVLTGRFFDPRPERQVTCKYTLERSVNE